jgi:hypothetical protein
MLLLDIFWVIKCVFVKSSFFLYSSFSVTLTLQAVSFSETHVGVYQTTRHCIREDSHFHTGRYENLKSRLTILCSPRDSDQVVVSF